MIAGKALTTIANYESTAVFVDRTLRIHQGLPCKTQSVFAVRRISPFAPIDAKVFVLGSSAVIIAATVGAADSAAASSVGAGSDCLRGLGQPVQLDLLRLAGLAGPGLGLVAAELFVCELEQVELHWLDLAALSCFEVAAVG